MTRHATWVGWTGSILFHGLLFLALAFGARHVSRSGTVVRLGGGGAIIQVDLLAPTGQPPPSPPPREIRKYEETPPLPPPTPEDIPELREKKKTRQRETRPTRAPNVRAPRKPPREASPKPPSPATPSTVRFGVGRAPGGGGWGEGIGETTPFPYQDYIAAVKLRIQTNWRPLVPALGQPTTYRARVFFTIDRTGRVIEYRLLQSSGHHLYDMSIRRAIYFAQPFPPLPAGYWGQTLSFDLWFVYKPS